MTLWDAIQSIIGPHAPSEDVTAVAARLYTREPMPGEIKTAARQAGVLED